MIPKARDRYELWSGLAVALLLLIATLDAYVAVGLATGLLVAGAVLFPALRRVGLLAALIAGLTAAGIGIARAL